MSQAVTMKRPLTTMIFALTLVAPLALHADPAMQARIEAQMAAPDRHEYDPPRDAARKPYETFRFLGLEAGMTALDVGAYAGYTSEMLAAAVGPTGKVFSHNTRRVLERYAASPPSGSKISARSPETPSGRDTWGSSAAQQASSAAANTG